MSEVKFSKTDYCFQIIRLRILLKGIGMYYEYYKSYAYNLAFLMYLKRTEQKQKRTKGTTGETTVIRGKSNVIKKHVIAPALVKTEETFTLEVKYFYLSVTIILKMPIFYDE